LLRTVGVAGAAAFAIVPPAAVRGAQANSAISVGLVGAAIAGTTTPPIVHADPRARVTAVCDLFDDRIEPAVKAIIEPALKTTTDPAAKTIKAQKPDVYKDFEKLLASGVDAVIIATPPFEHPAHAGRRGRGRQARLLREAGGRRPGGMQVGNGHGAQSRPQEVPLLRFSAAPRDGLPRSLQAVPGRADRGDCQRPRILDRRQSVHARSLPGPKVEKLRNWFCYRDYSGDFLIEQDCHNLDALHWFLDALPLRAVGYGGRRCELPSRLSITCRFLFGIPRTAST